MTNWRFRPSHTSRPRRRPTRPPSRQLDVSAEFSKRITEDFAVSVSPTWTQLYAPGGPDMMGASGFQNLETAFKYRLYKNDEHEFVFSAGLEHRMGRQRRAKRRRRALHAPTRPRSISAKAWATCRWMRCGPSRSPAWSATPFRAKSATTIRHRHRSRHRRPESSTPNFNPRVLVWGGSLQYSMPYLKSAVVDLGLPDVVNHLIPIVEASLQTPVSNTFTSGP